ncbi:MAG: extracellular solute-binding protein [Gammaproteobacteria bacterium]|nr:extracellular solute-binding protein [Gammaproteobacteria bacterium]
MKKTLTISAFLLGLVFLTSPASAEGKLNIYNWFDYLPQELIDKFSAEHDVEVTMDTYDSNESLLAKLKSGVTGYDVAVPGDYMVQILIEEGMLEQVNASEFENFGNMDPDWVDVYFDPGRLYSVPYQWGTTGFMVDTEVYGGEIDTLEIIFNPPAELQGKINMLKDVNDVLNAGLRYLGLDRCNENPEDLKKLNDLLTNAKQHWLSFNSDGAKEVLVSGDAAAGQIWNGFGMRARAEKASLKYAYPKEGFTGWMDNIVALKGGPNLENAKKFMNFMLDPENAAMLTNFARYTAGVSGTEPFLDDDLKTAHETNLPASAPTPDFVPPCNDKVVKLYDRIWTNLLK